MNIDLKFSVDEIIYIRLRIDATKTVLVKTLNRDQLSVLSIMTDIGAKISKKEHSMDSDFGVFTNKKYKLKLKYHEAIILEMFILDAEKFELDPYNKNLALTIKNQLNQKLA